VITKPHHEGKKNSLSIVVGCTNAHKEGSLAADRINATGAEQRGTTAGSMDCQQQREGESEAMVTNEGKCAPRSLSMRWGQLGALVGHDGRCLAPDLLPVTFLTHR